MGKAHLYPGKHQQPEQERSQPAVLRDRVRGRHRSILLQDEANHPKPKERGRPKLVTDFARVNVHTDFCSHYNLSSRDPNFTMSLDQAEQMILSAIRKQPDDTTAVSLASSSSTKFTRTEKVQSGKVGKRKSCNYCRRPGH